MTGLLLYLLTAIACSQEISKDSLFIRQRSSKQLHQWMLACGNSDEQYDSMHGRYFSSDLGQLSAELSLIHVMRLQPSLE